MSINTSIITSDKVKVKNPKDEEFKLCPECNEPFIESRHLVHKGVGHTLSSVSFVHGEREGVKLIVHQVHIIPGSTYRKLKNASR